MHSNTERVYRQSKTLEILKIFSDNISLSNYNGFKTFKRNERGDCQREIDLSFIQNPYFKSSLNDYLESLFRSNKEVLGIILFGSLATQKAQYTAEKVSDIDLLVVFENKELPSNHMERTQLKIDLMGFSLSGIDSIWMNESEFEGSVANKSDLILGIFDEGIILYDPKNYLHDSKMTLLRELDEKGIKKKKGYWIWPQKRLDEVIEW